MAGSLSALIFSAYTPIFVYCSSKLVFVSVLGHFLMWRRRWRKFLLTFLSLCWGITEIWATIAPSWRTKLDISAYTMTGKIWPCHTDMILCMCGPSTKLFDTGQVIFCHFTGIVLLCHFVFIRVYFTNQLMLMFFEVGRRWIGTREFQN